MQQQQHAQHTNTSIYIHEHAIVHEKESRPCACTVALWPTEGTRLSPEMWSRRKHTKLHSPTSFVDQQGLQRQELRLFSLQQGRSCLSLPSVLWLSSSRAWLHPLRLELRPGRPCGLLKGPYSSQGTPIAWPACASRRAQVLVDRASFTQGQRPSLYSPVKVRHDHRGRRERKSVRL